jgi:GDP/UDP-N,N'-diacetylbacillosamine 2-epimerase (hydrolysing)
MKKICFFTGSRSEYHLSKNLIKIFLNSNEFDTKLIVSGSHLSKRFGNTISDIVADKIKPSVLIKTNEKFDSAQDITGALSVILKKSNLYLKKDKPDLMVLVGDRYETFCIGLTCLIMNIPVAHIHGGEVTEGSYDDNFRHALTKFSHFHFVSNKTFKRRVIQLGEQPKNVFIVGGLGVDNIKKVKLLSNEYLAKKFKLKTNNFLVTFHASTLQPEKSVKILKNLLNVLKGYHDYKIIFTYPSSDFGNSKLIKLLKDFKIKNQNIEIVKSLGMVNYLSLLKRVNLVIGNSSSGIAEAPTFNTPTINIGDRQKGRLYAKSIISCDGEIISIKKSIKKGLSEFFLKSLRYNQNPYGNGGACDKIYKIIKNIKLDKQVIKKKFYDINYEK